MRSQILNRRLLEGPEVDKESQILIRRLLGGPEAAGGEGYTIHMCFAIRRQPMHLGVPGASLSGSMGLARTEFPPSLVQFLNSSSRLINIARLFHSLLCC